MSVFKPIYLSVAVLVVGGVAVAASATAAAPRAQQFGPVHHARAATVQYQSLATAKKAGYGLLKDAKGIACIAMPGMGGMGVHYVNGNKVGDDRLHITRPEALVYEPSAGGMRLAALEYIVFKSNWHQQHRPRLFGHAFNLTTSPNRFGLPPFYSLHAWIWKSNPAGMFAMWNPQVHCPSRLQTQVHHARAATTRFHSLATARNAGYRLLRDAKGIACIAMPGMGGMGLHLVNGNKAGDDRLHITRPEALVYRPTAHGLRLAALEYIVFKSTWHQVHRPRLFGHAFNLTTSPNRFGLPAFYSLHAWIWKSNPAGMFAMWNPQVHCH